MKKLAVLLISFLVLIAFVPREKNKAGIHGQINPGDGARKVSAIMGMDSVIVFPVAGKFSLDLKPGTWTLFVEGITPYKNNIVENVYVLDNISTDVGIIQLQKQ